MIAALRSMLGHLFVLAGLSVMTEGQQDEFFDTIVRKWSQ